MTGWDWQARRSRWVAFDFDSLTGHAKGVGISDEELEKVRQAAEAPALRRSPQEHRRQRHPPLRLLRRSRHPDRQPHRTRRPGPLHPWHDVERDRFRLRLPDRLLRRRHVGLASEDDGREQGLARIKAATKVLTRPICRPTGGITSKWSPASAPRCASTRSPRRTWTHSRRWPRPEDRPAGRVAQGEDRGPTDAQATPRSGLPTITYCRPIPKPWRSC